MSGIAKKKNKALWERCKKDAVSKMGGKWSARAAQYATLLYKKRGGKYSGKKPTAKNNKLKKWTKQKWMYLSDFKRKKKKEVLLAKVNFFKIAVERYLPEAKWESLSPNEREATNKKKKKSKKQWVKNTRKAKVKSKSDYYPKD